MLLWAFLSAVAAGSGAVMAIGLREQQVARARLEVLAETIGGTLHFQGLTLIAQVQGCHVRVTSQGFRADTMSTSVVVAGRGPLRDLWITGPLEPPLVGSYQEPLVPSMDPGLDAVLRIRGDEAYVRAVLTEDVRRTLYRISRTLGVSIAGGRVVWYPSPFLLTRSDGLSHVRDTILELARLAQALDIRDDEIPLRLANTVEQDPAASVRLAALHTAIRFYPKHEAIIHAAHCALRDGDAGVRFLAARHLPERSKEELLELATKPGHPPELRAKAIHLMTARFGAEALGQEELIRLSRSSEPGILLATASAMSELSTAEVESRLMHLLLNRNLSVRVAAAAALGRTGTLRAVEALLPHSRGILVDNTLRRTANWAIENIRKRAGDVEGGRVSIVEIDERSGHLGFPSEIDRTRTKASSNIPNDDS